MLAGDFADRTEHYPYLLRTEKSCGMGPRLLVLEIASEAALAMRFEVVVTRLRRMMVAVEL